jgi:hypothetical protein
LEISGCDTVTIHSASFDSTIVEPTHGVAWSIAATSSDDIRHFGTGQKGFVGDEFDLEICALDQCLSSLSQEDCGSCLKVLFDTMLTENMNEVMVTKVWCNFHFAPQHFFMEKLMSDLLVNDAFIAKSNTCYKFC